jgi:thymidylate synthase (FAD)
MRQTTPEVYLIAHPHIDGMAVWEYLKSVGGEDWWFEKTASAPVGGVNEAESLIEFCGRLCYRSWKPGLNANVKKIREDSAEYFENLLQSGHGSVLEHANFTFVFHNVSRVFSHELVRHRAGVAISQESLRYVRLTDLGFRIPAVLEPMKHQIIDIVERLEEFQVEAAANLGLDDDGVPFHVKKEVTSALRRLAPIGLSTSIVWTANVRTLRHVIEARTAAGAEEEIRYVFDKVALVMQKECPLLFQDFEARWDLDEDTQRTPAQWVPRYHKV